MACPCGKSVRQRLYCHRPDCGTMTAVDLPPPTVDVTQTPTPAGEPCGSVDVVVHRDGKGRSYRVEGSNATDLVKGAVEKVLGDHYSGEWIPKG